ncbi:MAG TPA: hypothetical protein VGC78_07845 [Gaiellaceae bacterium]
MAVTLKIGGVLQELPDADAASLAEELRAIGDGYRGDYASSEVAYAVADAIEDRLDVGDDEAISVNDPEALEALQRALNSVVHEVGPAMQLHNIADMARRSG